MVAKVAKLSGISIGKGFPIVVQSMLKKPFLSYTQSDLRFLYNLGCDAMRFSLLGESRDELAAFVKKSPFPLIADIQGNLSQALTALECGVSGIRINPGNFEISLLDKVVLLAKEKQAAIRIGINKASLGEKNIFDEIKKYIRYFEDHGFGNLVVSIKSSSLSETLSLNREYAKLFSYPLHLGLTEAGFGVISAVRSTLVLAELLKEGIGSTIRYSISGSEEDEIRSACELLVSLKLRKLGLNFVSCPMCARAGIDTSSFSREIERDILSTFDIRKLNLHLAVMGCVVNGRGEAKDADVAICALKGKKCEIYIKGAFHSLVATENLKDVLCNIIREKYC